jgi:WS/DGAT/MGAT family acyltransferase
MAIGERADREAGRVDRPWESGAQLRDARHVSARRIDRLGPQDMTILAAEASGARMQFAAIAVLDGAPTPAEVWALLASRIDAVPRLRQRLVRVSPGRPIWLGDPAFELADHVGSMTCPPAGGRAALLAAAARIVEERLSLARPPWRMVVIGGLDPGSVGGRSALVIVLHHVLADGLAGLTILSRLVDGAEPRTVGPPVGARPRTTGRRRAGTRRLIGRAALLRAGAAELLRDGTRGAPACSINAGPVGPRRALGVAHAELAPLIAAAKAAGGTVNDVALTAVTGALRDLLAARGERPDRLVVSIPITARRRAEVAELGNRTGVLPVSLPQVGSPRERLPVVAEITRSRKTDSPGASAAWYGPFARALAGVGAFGWFIGHQRLVNTFVTNVRGPAQPQAFGGRRIVELIPVSPISGNVGVGFAVLSYAGRLSMTVVADADRCPDVDRLAALVQAQLDELSAAPAPVAGTARPPGTKRPAGTAERRRPDPAAR